jgi:hypothetical protein
MVTVDGLPRFVAYCWQDAGTYHIECSARGNHQTSEKPYYYYPERDSDRILPLCDGCVRGENADPRFVWWAEARRAGLPA